MIIIVKITLKIHVLYSVNEMTIFNLLINNEK